MASTRRALCVGINNFKNYPQSALQGCVRDANDMSSLLKDFLGFSSSDITLLTDAQATKTEIMKNLKSMVDDAKAGKVNHLIFSFSSHGTLVPDTSGDEPDKADEAFCPHDLAQKGNDWDPNHIIVDDELRDLIVQIPKNVQLEVFLDTCHSGTGLRVLDLLPDRKPRFLPPPSLEAFEEIEDRVPRDFGVKLLEKALEKGLTKPILWAGCRADQTSADAYIAGGWHGAFTYFFCKEMLASKNKLPRKDLLLKVRKDLKAGRYTQTPQLECEAKAKKTPLEAARIREE